jgi:hypothetical protein
MKRKLFVWLLCGLSMAFMAGCDILNPDETLPSVIHVEPFDFQVSPGQGSANNRITEVWVYANSNLLGAFAMPVDIHYLETGPTTLTLRPGIRNNGIVNDAIIYPMFNSFTTEIDASPGSPFSVTPVTGYKPEVVFSFMEDFEVTNMFVDNRDTIAASQLVRTQDTVFEGDYAAKITLSEEAHFIDVTHAIAMADLPTDGTATYLELRYKSDVEFSIGLTGINLQGQNIDNFFYLVRPSEEWNMLYIELSDLLSLSGFPAYKIAFRSLFVPGTGKTTFTVYLDNIKVVHLLP